MEKIKQEIEKGIFELESLKYKYPTMETSDVIKMLKRLNEIIKLN